MSPIKGLTDRGLSFPEIGQIRKGAKKTENRPGKDLTFFRVEFDEREQETANIFRARYGDKPAQMNIILPFNEIERMWDAWYEAYTAGRMVARSDGEYIVYQLDDKGDMIVRNGVDNTGAKVPHPADGVAGHDYKDKPVLFKATGRLKVIIPELARAAYLTVMTTSIHDIANISAQLGAFKELNNGQLAGIPMILRRRPKEISTPSSDNGQRVRRVKWLISIEADPEWVKARLSAVKSLAMPSAEEILSLPANVENVESMTEYEPDEDEMETWDADIAENEEAEPPIQQAKLVPRESDAPLLTAKFLVDNGIVPRISHAEAMLKLLGIPEGSEMEAAMARIKLYLQWRKIYAKNTPKDREFAAQKAIAGEQPQSAA